MMMRPHPFRPSLQNLRNLRRKRYHRQFQHVIIRWEAESLRAESPYRCGMSGETREIRAVGKAVKKYGPCMPLARSRRLPRETLVLGYVVECTNA